MKSETVKKMKKTENVELYNLKQEILEELERCIKCGLCKSQCPVFLTFREEALSPRGKAILLADNQINDIAYKCTLCSACEKKCPLNIKIYETIRKAREAIVLEKPGKENQEMIKNIRETGNPFGKNPEKSKKLYCC